MAINCRCSPFEFFLLFGDRFSFEWVSIVNSLAKYELRVVVSILFLIGVWWWGRKEGGHRSFLLTTMLLTLTRIFYSLGSFSRWLEVALEVHFFLSLCPFLSFPSSEKQLFRHFFPSLADSLFYNFFPLSLFTSFFFTPMLLMTNASASGPTLCINRPIKGKILYKWKWIKVVRICNGLFSLFVIWNVPSILKK
jgi:hypothetical protein